MFKHTPLSVDERGVTIVELLVVIAVSSVLMGIMSGFALNYWSNSVTLSNDQSTLVSRLNAGDYLREALNASSGLIDQNDLPDAHTLNADPSDITGTHWVVIHAIPGTIAVGASNTYTPVFYFNRPSIDTSKNVILNGAIPYEDDVVIYMNGTTKQLLARTIANPYAPNNGTLTSCPPSVATTSCPADTVISDDVSSVTMRYFTRSGNPVDYTSIIDPLTGLYIGPDFPSVEIVELTLNIAKKAQLHNAINTTNSTVIRVALRN
jgi:prepilin-type N-terminal cleavage/methylation domain-containing protein